MLDGRRNVLFVRGVWIRQNNSPHCQLLYCFRRSAKFYAVAAQPVLSRVAIKTIELSKDIDTIELLASQPSNEISKGTLKEEQEHWREVLLKARAEVQAMVYEDKTLQATDEKLLDEKSASVPRSCTLEAPKHPVASGPKATRCSQRNTKSQQQEVE